MMSILKIDLLTAGEMKLQDLVPLLEQGDEIILMKGEKVITHIPPETNSDIKPNARIMGLHRGMIELADDFDDPLPEEFWLGGNP